MVHLAVPEPLVPFIIPSRQESHRTKGLRVLLEGEIPRLRLVRLRGLLAATKARNVKVIHDEEVVALVLLLPPLPLVAALIAGTVKAGLQEAKARRVENIIQRVGNGVYAILAFFAETLCVRLGCSPGKISWAHQGTGREGR